MTEDYAQLVKEAILAEDWILVAHLKMQQRLSLYELEPEKIYALKWEVENPHPDRRSRKTSAAPSWKAGTKVFVTYDGSFEFPDYSWSGTIRHSERADTWEAVAKNLVPVTKTVGQLLYELKYSCYADAADILVVLEKQGKITLEDIEQAALTYKNTPEE